MRNLVWTDLHKAMPYLGDNLDSSRSFLNSSLANNNLFFFSLYSSLILVLTNCSNIFWNKGNKIQYLLTKAYGICASLKGCQSQQVQLLSALSTGWLKRSWICFTEHWPRVFRNRQMETGIILTDNVITQTSSAT